MRTAGGILAAVLAAGGCGDQDLGVPAQTPVADLEEEDAIELCREFITLICEDIRGADYCNACMIYELCVIPELFSMMDVQCDGITVGEVRECAHLRRPEVCATTAGGCMFDVAEMLCPQED